MPRKDGRVNIDNALVDRLPPLLDCVQTNSELLARKKLSFVFQRQLKQVTLQLREAVARSIKSLEHDRHASTRALKSFLARQTDDKRPNVLRKCGDARISRITTHDYTRVLSERIIWPAEHRKNFLSKASDV